MSGLGDLADLATKLVQHRPIAGDIGRAVCLFYRVHEHDIYKHNRHKWVARARHVTMYLARRHADMSYPELGRAFGRDHTTVMHACQRVEALKASEPRMREELALLEQRLGVRGLTSWTVIP